MRKGYVNVFLVHTRRFTALQKTRNDSSTQHPTHSPFHVVVSSMVAFVRPEYEHKARHVEAMVLLMIRWRIRRRLLCREFPVGVAPPYAMATTKEVSPPNYKVKPTSDRTISAPEFIPCNKCIFFSREWYTRMAPSGLMMLHSSILYGQEC